jgi:hypothetical protein
MLGIMLSVDEASNIMYFVFVAVCNENPVSYMHLVSGRSLYSTPFKLQYI